MAMILCEYTKRYEIKRVFVKQFPVNTERTTKNALLSWILTANICIATWFLVLVRIHIQKRANVCERKTNVLCALYNSHFPWKFHRNYEFCITINMFSCMVFFFHPFFFSLFYKLIARMFPFVSLQNIVWIRSSFFFQAIYAFHMWECFFQFKCI